MNISSTQVPLSFQQQWLWDLMERHGDWDCVVSQAFTLTGALDIKLLQMSFNEVGRRHGSLRTRIVAVDGAVSQQVDDPTGYRADIAVSNGSADVPNDARARRFFEEFVDAKLERTAGQLLKVSLAKLTGEHHVLAVAFHRLIADCSSIEQVLREVWLLYGAFVQDQPAPLAPTPGQYGDYALWQRQAQSQWLRKNQAYWQTRLANAMPLKWQTDVGATGDARTLGRMSVCFGDTLSARLREFSREARTLSAAVMLTLYVAVLWRRCRQKDFVVPFKIAGRQSEHKAIVGYFTNILYLRIALTGEETFSGILSQVANEFFQSLSHEDFGRVATERPDLLAGTFFQWVTWHPAHAARLTLPAAGSQAGLTVEPLAVRDFGEGLTAIPPGMTAVEVTFFDTPKGINAFGVYRTDLFTQNSMERFMQDLRTAAEQFVNNPQERITAGSGDERDVV